MLNNLTIVQMARQIKNAIAQEGLTQAEFCRLVGRTTKHVNQVLNGVATASPGELDYWAHILGYHWEVSLSHGATSKTLPAPSRDGDGDKPRTRAAVGG